MRTAEDSSGTVLHRLIQEQLRYGNLADTRTLLAIQQQAQRGGGGGSSSSGGGGGGSPRSSLESLTQEDTHCIQMSVRQEPQGQEHQGECRHSERPVCQLYQLHREELPTYEEAKAHSQYLNYQKGQAELKHSSVDAMGSKQHWDLKREHARSLSERLMQLSLERKRLRDCVAMSSSHSYPQLYNDLTITVALDRQEDQLCTGQKRPPPDYPYCTPVPEYMVTHSQEQERYLRDPPPSFYSGHHRYQYVSAQPVVAHNSIIAASGKSSASSESLMQENERLRKEMEVYAEKAARLQKMELEIQRISEAYETLMKGSAKRETLEKTMRNRLEAEIKRLHDFNRDLREQLDTATKQGVAMEAECTDRKQQMFLKLLEQNEDQQREREGLERQIQHLRVSMEDSQRRRELLEKALASAHTRNRQLEEELEKKRAYVKKVERLQSALAQLQAACEKREALELRLRTRLEQDLKSLRSQPPLRSTGDTPYSDSIPATLQEQFREKEDRILALEADITKWEQKYLEESTIRQFAMNAAATAAAQRDTTIIKNSPCHSPDSSFSQEVPLSCHRHQEMENRIRILYAQLLEKDAVIKALHQRSKWEQGKLEKQDLRLSRSVPSINPVTSSKETKAKSLSDDQTCVVTAPQHQTLVTVSGPFPDTNSKSGDVPQKLEFTPQVISAATNDTLEEQQAPRRTSNHTNGPDTEMVEILI